MVEGVSIDFNPNFEELERELEDEDFTTEVSVQPDGAAGRAADTGGGGGGDLGGIAAEAALGGELGSDVAHPRSGITGMLGGISRMVVLLGAVVGFLALLEPIQKAVGFLMRQFELLIIPFILLLRPLMEAIAEMTARLIQFFRNPLGGGSSDFRGTAPQTRPGPEPAMTPNEFAQATGVNKTGDLSGANVTVQDMSRPEHSAELSDDARQERSQNLIGDVFDFFGGLVP